MPLNQWSHIATTYDGVNHKLFVNGAQVAAIARSGSLATSANSLSIGANTPWGEYFSGLIDEVRIYNRALSASEISSDMNTAITSGPTGTTDTTKPVFPSTGANLTATAASHNQVNLNWAAASDNIAVTKYDIRRNGVVIASIDPATNYTDNTATANTTYNYNVIARDAANNSSNASNVATVTMPQTPDDAAPSTPANLSAAASGPYQINLAWEASADEAGGSGLKEYQVLRNNVQIATVAAGFTSHGDGTVQPQTNYSYTVKAVDTKGNVSAASNVATATTPALPPVSGQSLLGSNTIQPDVDSVSTGQAEAFKATATGSGTGSSLTLYLNSQSTAKTVKVGVYTNNNNHPATLLSRATITTPKAGWNTIALPTTRFVAGTVYWIAVLTPSGTSGTIKFNDKLNGSSRSETSYQKSLISLPTTWKTGTAFKDGPLSAYVSP